ncbi:hypothetical protein BDZ89DRAFT_1234851 [Hymenopellis radicata]|nr:hypothetical protein BDZ89DRAFT_1234851 [Hymenopellis radicata]
MISALDSESAPYKWRTTLSRLHGNTTTRMRLLALDLKSASAYFKEETPPATLNSVLEERGRQIWAASSSAGDAAEVSIARQQGTTTTTGMTTTTRTRVEDNDTEVDDTSRRRGGGGGGGGSTDSDALTMPTTTIGTPTTTTTTAPTTTITTCPTTTTTLSLCSCTAEYPRAIARGCSLSMNELWVFGEVDPRDLSITRIVCEYSQTSRVLDSFDS